ncbi:hypothetical protein AWN76_007145 [Rhodothermaceae bacterium RA]|nr:hypothetical protein AWN76_007145 [Rhodothermaceae bacterium RA]
MHLVLDAGNSRIKAGLADAGRIVHALRIDYDRAEAPEHIAGRVLAALPNIPVDRAGLTSVVPPVTGALRDAVATRHGCPTLVIDHRVRLPFTLAYETPHTLGTDRLAAAAAAWALFGRDPEGVPHSVVAVDAGTAVTYEVITRDGRYLGGAIAAGPGLTRQALRAGTAQLPAVEPTLPTRAIGRSTREAIQAGMMFGFLDGVAGMLRRIAAALQEAPFVVATGGWGPLLADQLPAIDRLEPDLVLLGIDVLLHLNPATTTSPQAPA